MCFSTIAHTLLFGGLPERYKTSGDGLAAVERLRYVLHDAPRSTPTPLSGVLLCATRVWLVPFCEKLCSWTVGILASHQDSEECAPRAALEVVPTRSLGSEVPVALLEGRRPSSFGSAAAMFGPQRR